MFSQSEVKLQKLNEFLLLKNGADDEAKKIRKSLYEVECLTEDKVIINFNVDNTFGFLSTEEEYNYEKGIKNQIYNGKKIFNTTSNIKSKVIDRMEIVTKNNQMLVKFRVRVYSREFKLVYENKNIDLENLIRKKESKGKFKLEDSYKEELLETIYDVKENTVTGFLSSNSRCEYLKSQDGKLDLDFCAMVENLIPDICLFAHIKLLKLISKYSNRSFVNKSIEGFYVSCDLNPKKLFSQISEKSISVKEYENTIKAYASCTRFIPLMRMWECELLIKFNGYVLEEQSYNLNEVQKLSKLSEKEILKKAGLRTCKMYKELIAINLENYKNIKLLMNAGFSNEKIIYSILSKAKDSREIYPIGRSFILQKYIQKHGEKKTCKKALSEYDSLKKLSDCNEMMLTILGASLESLEKIGYKEKITIDNFDNYFNFNKNLNNLERDLIKISSLVDGNNYELKYIPKSTGDSEFFRYNLPNIDYSQAEHILYKEEEYSFVLPLNSGIIKSVGSNLSICINSYVKKVVAQTTVLVLVKRDSEYIGCLELDVNYEELVQAKIRFNKRFSEKEQCIISNFCNVNELRINTRDMQRLDCVSM